MTPGLELRLGLYSGNTLSESENPHSRPVIRGRDGVLSLYEAAYRLNREENAPGLPGTYKLGGVFHSRFRGPLNEHPGVVNASEYAVYVVADQSVWRAPRSEVGRDKTQARPGVGLFFRAGYVPEDVGFVSRYFDGGINFNGLIPGRGGDLFGLGVTHSGVSRDARRASVRAGGPPLRSETLVETTYSAKLTPWLTLQPDFQYVFDPGATPGARNATVLGLRTSLSF